MSKVNTAPAIADPGYTAPPPVREPAPVQAPAPDIEAQSDFRLVIEEDEASGSFIYKTMDRRTGEVIQQFPREEILRLKEVEQYSAGSLVNARA